MFLHLTIGQDFHPTEAKGVEHVIDTGDSQPMHQLPRRVPFALRKEILHMVQEILVRWRYCAGIGWPLGKSRGSGQKERRNAALLR